MVELARAGDKNPVPLSRIAKRQQISVKYLEQLIIPLRKAGLIKSVRGAKGGYVLNMPPSEISVARILDILENGLFFVKCVAMPEECDRSQSCITRNLWAFLQEAFYKRLESLTLEDVVNGIKGEEGW
jgi:Rrf2 family protein